jgi:hypothetical protein
MKGIQRMKTLLKSENPWVVASASLVLFEKGQIGSQEPLEFLKNLEHLWRGGDIEKKVLEHQYDQFKKKKNAIGQLKTLQYLLERFPHSFEIGQWSLEGHELFHNRFFSQGILSPLEKITMFKVFPLFYQDTPSWINQSYLMMAKTYKDLNLLDQAHDYLNKIKENDLTEKDLMSYRDLKIEQARQNGDIPLLKFLLKREMAKGDKNRQEKLALEYGRILMDEGKWGEFIHHVERYQTQPFICLKGEGLWLQKKWESSIDPLLNCISQQTMDPIENRQRLLKIAIALKKSGLFGDLRGLGRQYQKEMSSYPEGPLFNLLTQSKARSQPQNIKDILKKNVQLQKELASLLQVIESSIF